MQNVKELQMESQDFLSGNMPLKLSQGATVCAHDYSMKIYSAGLNPLLLASSKVDTAIAQANSKY